MTVRGAARFDTEWLLTMRHVADRLDVSYRTVERLVASGAIAHTRVGHLIRIHPTALRAYLEARSQEAAPAPSVQPSAARAFSGRRSARPESYLDELTAVER